MRVQLNYLGPKWELIKLNRNNTIIAMSIFGTYNDALITFNKWKGGLK